MNGIYPYGARLPSKRTFAEEMGVSVSPVEHGYTLLIEEGYAEARERSGYFSIYRESDFAGSMENKEKIHEQPHPIAKEITGLPIHPTESSFPFPLFAKKMRWVLSEYGERILEKSPNHGCRPLRQAIAAYLARSCGIRCQPEQVIVGAGSEYLYSILSQLLGRDHIFALENPCYEKIKQVYAANGIRYEMLKMGQDGIKSSELQNSSATVLHVTPFHSFPSGISASASKRREYLHFAAERGGYIIEDNYDSELTVSGKCDNTLFGARGELPVLYLNTFSGTVAPSIRVGYLVLPESLLVKYEEKVGFYSCTVPMLEQLFLTELLISGDFERHINRLRRQKRKQQKIK